MRDSDQLAPADMGRRIILPATFTGSGRYRQKCYRDSLAIMAQYGKPTFFITFTANPHWPDIDNELICDDAGVPIQDAFSRPDLVACVFNMCLECLLHDLCKKEVLGPYRAHVYVVEYQKRGLPHAHILLWIGNSQRFLDPTVLNDVISAEILSVEDCGGEQLYTVVTKMMMHRPCGDYNPTAPCMKEINGVWTCSKHFPKAFCDATEIKEDSYPQYCCRNALQIRVEHPN